MYSRQSEAAPDKATTVDSGLLLHAWFDQAPQPLILLDDQLRVVHFNSLAARLWKDFFQLTLNRDGFFCKQLPQRERLPLETALNQALHHRAGIVHLSGKDQEGKPAKKLELSCKPLVAAHDGVGGILVALNEPAQEVATPVFDGCAEENLQLLLHNLNEAFVLVGTDLRIRLFNDAALAGVERVTGRKLTSGASVFDYLIQPNVPEALNATIQSALSGNTLDQEIPLQLPASDGVLKVRIQPAYDAAGKIAGCMFLAIHISRQQLGEQQLANNEQRWRFALEGSNQGVWDWNLVEDRISYSHSWYRMLNYPEGSMGSSIQDWEAALHPEDLEQMRLHRTLHLDGDLASYESEYRMLDGKGHYRWILARGMIMEWAPEGKPLRMIGTHTDITERKEVEEKYKALFYKNPLPMWTYDRQTLRFIDVNEAAIQQYGYSLEEFCSMTIRDIRPEEDQLLLQQQIEYTERAGVFEPGVWRHRRKDGSLVLANITGFIFHEKNRTIALVTAEDITSKASDEEKLKASEALYRHLFQNIPLPAFVYDPETLNIVEANSQSASVYGYLPTEFQYMKLSQLAMEKEGEKQAQEKSAYSSTDEAVSISRLSHLTRTGKHLEVEVWSSYMGMPGSRLRLAIMNDITEKIEAEEALKASSERFRYVMNATNDIVWDWKVGEDRVLWSDHYQDILGWQLPADKHLPAGQAVESFHPDDRERVVESLVQALKTTSEVLWENAFRYQRKDGSFAYVLAKGFILRNTEGKAYRVIGAIHDISEQQYQLEVQELELRVFSLSSKPDAQLPLVLENIAGGLEQLHPQQRAFVVRFGEGGRTEVFAKHKSLRAEDWLKTFVLEHKNEWGKTSLRKNLTTHILESTDRNFLMAEWPGFNAVQLLSLPVLTSDGSLLASLVVLVTELNGLSHAELGTLSRMQNLMRILVIQHVSVEQIRQANERFDNVLKATHDLIWDWDLVNGTFYRSPEGMRRLYGVEPEKSIHNVHDWMSRIHREDHAKVQQIIENILRSSSEDTFEVEYRFLRDDGTHSHLYDRGIIIRNDTGMPIRMIGAAQNISERKRLEQELLQQELERQRVISKATIDTQEQERAEIGKELHDNVNQILTTTKLYLELAQSNHELKDDLVAKSSQNIIHVINEIRQLSRSLMDPSIGDLGLVASIKDLVDNINLTRRIRIMLTADEALDSMLDASQKLMVFRIVQEAMSNIIRHAQANEVKILLIKKGNTALLQVTDNGIGFDPDDVKSGIGLKNIRNRVYLTNGNLRIDSAPGMGTTLAIKFPIHKSPQ